VERWRIYDVVDILENIGVLSRKMEESSLLEMFCSDSSLFASTQGRRFEKGFWYLEYLQHVFESRGFQFSDSDHAVGDSVESCKDDDKWAKEIDGNHSSGDSNEAGTKLGVHNINANSGFPETVDLVFYMDKNEKACDLRDIVICYKENILIMS
ncbi:hypothetical protein HID58_066369, partial [Brassica napus]